jgi:hypothetical protein
MLELAKARTSAVVKRIFRFFILMKHELEVCLLSDKAWVVGREKHGTWTTSFRASSNT